MEISIEEIESKYSWIYLSSEKIKREKENTLIFYQAIVCNMNEENFNILYSVLLYWEIEYFNLDLLEEFTKFDPNILTNVINRKSEYFRIIEFLNQDESTVCNFASKNGYLDMLIYAHKMECYWNKHTFMFAIFGGHLDCVKYLHENRCPKHDLSCEIAVKYGRLDILKFLHENGFKWNEIIYSYDYDCEECNNFPCEFLKDYYGEKNHCISILAISSGKLEIVKYLFENGCIFSEIACYHAAYEGQLNILIYLRSVGFECDTFTFETAVCNGYFEIVKYLFENECPVNPTILDSAVLRCQNEISKYLYEKGFPLNKNALRIATFSGNIEILKYFREKGNNITNEMMAAAAEIQSRYTAKNFNKKCKF